MPPLLKYKVTQTNEVKVTATNSQNAIDLARRVFAKAKYQTDQLNVLAWPREINIVVKEDQ